MIIFISSSLGAGKTTTAKKLAGAVADAVLVDPDVFSEMMEYSMLFEEYIPHTNALAEYTIRYMHTLGKVVIVPGSITQSHYETLKSRYADIWSDVRIVCLNPQKEVVLVGRGERVLNEWEKSRIEFHYANRATCLPDAHCIVDTTNCTPEDAVVEIVNALTLLSK